MMEWHCPDTWYAYLLHQQAGLLWRDVHAGLRRTRRLVGVQLPLRILRRARSSATSSGSRHGALLEPVDADEVVLALDARTPMPAFPG